MTPGRYDWGGPWPDLLPRPFGAWLARRAIIYLWVAMLGTAALFLVAAGLAGYGWGILVTALVCLAMILAGVAARHGVASRIDVHRR